MQSYAGSRLYAKKAIGKNNLRVQAIFLIVAYEKFADFYIIITRYFSDFSGAFISITYSIVER